VTTFSGPVVGVAERAGGGLRALVGWTREIWGHVRRIPGLGIPTVIFTVKTETTRFTVAHEQATFAVPTEPTLLRRR
jgi:hypothetical protein